MTDKPRRGFPAKYVLVKLLLLPADRDYIDQVKEAQNRESRNAAGRLVVDYCRTNRLFLDGIDANIATTQKGTTP